MVTAPRRSPRRRSSEEVQTRILDAARELFAAQGYRSTTTKEIALKAGVAEPLIFSNFGSKAKLFEATIVQPFTAAISDFADSWTKHPATVEQAEEISRQMLIRLFDLSMANRDIIRLLLAAQVDSDDPLQAIAETVSRSLAGLLESVQQPSVLEETGRFFELEDPECTVAAALGMVLSVVILDDWLFPSGKRRPGRARQLGAMQRLLLHGIYPERPPSVAPSPPPETGTR
jgi:AcrR family transcriptional regulator